MIHPELERANETLLRHGLWGTELMQRLTVVEEALEWLNTPYHHHGRLKGVGVDCAMILAEGYQKCGIIEGYDPGFYPVDWHLHHDEERYLKGIEKFAAKVELPLPGDVALFQFGRCVSHGAIVLSWPIVLHAYVREGVILEDASASRLGDRLRGFWSFWRK